MLNCLILEIWQTYIYIYIYIYKISLDLSFSIKDENIGFNGCIDNLIL